MSRLAKARIEHVQDSYLGIQIPLANSTKRYENTHPLALDLAITHLPIHHLTGIHGEWAEQTHDTISKMLSDYSLST